MLPMFCFLGAIFFVSWPPPVFLGKLLEAEAVCAHALSIVEENEIKGEKTPHLMAALLKLQSRILKRQGKAREEYFLLLLVFSHVLARYDTPISSTYRYCWLASPWHKNPADAMYSDMCASSYAVKNPRCHALATRPY